MEQVRSIIRVEMLGSFAVYVDGRPVELGSNRKANFLKLLQIVLLNRENGISKRELIDGVFGYKELLDENNSLNNLLHQARAQLKKGGVPGRKYIEGKKGVYTIEKLNDCVLQVDINDYKEKVRAAQKSEDPDEKARLYEDAAKLYKGPLLQDFSTEYWVIVQAVQLKHMYDDLLDYLGNYYKKHQDYEKLYELYSRANEIYPDNGWQVNVIDALILKKEYAKAYDLYNKTAQYYLEELEVPIPQALLDCYNRIYDDASIENQDIEGIQASIVQRDAALKRAKEGSRVGSYYCAFTSFVDVYHVLRRNLSRRGSSIFMMLCTLVDYEGKPIQSQDKLNMRADALKEALQEALRQGDVFTKYSSSQFLVLLIGTKKEDCTTIYQRISRRLKDLAGSRAELKYRIVSLGEIPSILDRSHQVS